MTKRKPTMHLSQVQQGAGAFIASTTPLNCVPPGSTRSCSQCSTSISDTHQPLPKPRPLHFGKSCTSPPSETEQTSIIGPEPSTSLLDNLRQALTPLIFPIVAFRSAMGDAEDRRATLDTPHALEDSDRLVVSSSAPDRLLYRRRAPLPVATLDDRPCGTCSAVTYIWGSPVGDILISGGTYGRFSSGCVCGCDADSCFCLDERGVGMVWWCGASAEAVGVMPGETECIRMQLEACVLMDIALRGSFS